MTTIKPVLLAANTRLAETPRPGFWISVSRTLRKLFKKHFSIDLWGSPMPDTDPLDALYDAACKTLLEAMGSVFRDEHWVALLVIDRWLQRREADRQYELQCGKRIVLPQQVSESSRRGGKVHIGVDEEMLVETCPHGEMNHWWYRASNRAIRCLNCDKLLFGKKAQSDPPQDSP